MSEVPWVVRLVDKPDPDRTVRFDLNDEEAGGNVYVIPDGFTLGVGEVEVATTGSMLTDGDKVTASRRVNREPIIPIAVVGDSTDLATVLNKLTRELDRDRNYLEFRPSDHTGESVFFTVLPGSDFGEVDLDPDDYPDEKGLQLNLLCEPVGVGLTQTGTATVTNDPASGQIATLPTVKGDVPAPLSVEAAWTGNQSGASTVLLARHVTADGTPLARTEQVDSTWTMQPDTSLQANDTLMSGAGQNYARVTFATDTTLRSRAVKTVALPVGTYKVFARVRKSASTADVDVRLQTGVGRTINGPTRRVPGSAQPTVGPVWVDLGTLTCPEGATVPPGVTTASVVLRLQAGRASGTGTFDFDAVRLVPSMDFPDLPDPELSLLYHAGDSNGNPVTLGWDGETDRVYAIANGVVGGLRVKPGPTRLRVLPGWANHLVLMRHVGFVADTGSVAGTDKLTDTTTVTWRYRPRFAYLSEPS